MKMSVLSLNLGIRPIGVGEVLRRIVGKELGTIVMKRYEKPHVRFKHVRATELELKQQSTQ